MSSYRKVIAIVACLLIASVPLFSCFQSDTNDSDASDVCTVHYENYATQKISKNPGLVTPPSPYEPGYDLECWWCEGVKFYANVESSLYKAFTTIPDEITMTATWYAHKYQATFVDGTTTVSTKQCTINMPIGELPTVSKTGYTFVGWSPTGSASDIINKKWYYSNPYDMTFIAVWNAKTYDVSLKDGDQLFQTVKCTYNSKIGQLPSMEKQGYIFMGWSFNREGTQIVSSTTIYDRAEASELYAIWATSTYTLTFIDDGVIYGTKQVKFSSNIGELPTPTKDGMTFVGWSYDEAGTQMVNDLTIFDKTQDTNLYSNWVANTYTITYINEGSEYGKSNATYGEKIGEMPTPESTGKEFIGWSFDGSASSMVTEDTEYTFTDNIKLYSVYRDIEYTISFDPTGGDTTPEPIKCKYNAPFGDLPTVSQEDKVFKGWSLTEDGTSMVDPGTKLTQAKDITLYAVWEDVQHGGGGEGGGGDGGFHLSFDNPWSIFLMVIIILLTLTVAYWVYRRGTI